MPSRLDAEQCNLLGYALWENFSHGLGLDAPFRTVSLHPTDGGTVNPNVKFIS